MLDVKESKELKLLDSYQTVPSEEKSRDFCLVAEHLIKNAHRYYSVDDTTVKEEVKREEVGTGKVEKMTSEEQSEEEKSQLGNKLLRTIITLKRQNRIREQQEFVQKMKEQLGTYHEIMKITGTPLKTVHDWCSHPKERSHKGTVRSNLRKQEFMNFLMQDTITYAHPCKRYAGKHFLLDTWDQIYQKYLAQTEFHRHGIMAKSTVRYYRPKYVLLSGCTPLNICLCDSCENCDLLRRALLAVGIKGIPSNKYSVIESTLCDVRSGQFGITYEFRKHSCITRECNQCGQGKLLEIINGSNEELLCTNQTLTWHRWQLIQGKSAPQKCAIKGTL